MALVGLAGFLTAYLLRHRPFWAHVSKELRAAGAGGTAGAGTIAAGGAALLRQSAVPVALLHFSDLRCEVPLRREWRVASLSEALPWRRPRAVAAGDASKGGGGAGAVDLESNAGAAVGEGSLAARSNSSVGGTASYPTKARMAGPEREDGACRRTAAARSAALCRPLRCRTRRWRRFEERA